jgi:hypothetical protein
LESRIDSPSELNGLVIPQFYLEVGIDDLTVQIGHFAAGMGYEMVPAPNNFFYSHDYCFGYSEAVLVTGVQADYKFSDQWDLIGGFNRGWNMFEDNNDCLDFLGGVKWHNDDKSTILSYEIDVGAQDAAGADNQYAYALVLQQKLTDKLLYVAQHNLGGTETPRAGVPYGMWYGLDQYLIYTYSPTLSFGSRLEFFRDNNGTRVAGIGNVSAAFTGVTGSGWDAAPGFAGTFNEVTLGLNWRPHPSVVLRPEFRYDWYNGTSNLQGQRPFGDGTQNNQITMAMDLVITY